MGQRLIITEEEKKDILSLYEQSDNQFKKENDFLKKYVNKTFLIYKKPDFQLLSQQEPIKIDKITYYNGLKIVSGEDIYFVDCLHNPNRLGYEISKLIPNKFSEYWPLFYNKTLIDNINQQGTSLGIKWCQKPKSDFGVKQSTSDTDKMV